MHESSIIDAITEGNGLSLQDVARMIPPRRQGKKLTIGAVLRWILDGVKGPGGRRIRLEAARLGGRWLTTRAAVAAFIAAQTPVVEQEAAKPRTTTQRRKASERAGRELARRGI